MIQISKGQIKTGKLVQRTDYYASGEPWLEPTYGNGASGNRYLFGGKERMAGGALNEYDFEARNYVASFQRFTTIDPEAEKFPWLSPYAYCNANPINFIDPTGMNPIYSPSGKFLGTDEGGLKGCIYIMNESDFEQGMSTSKVEELSLMNAESEEAWKKIEEHHGLLYKRPDYDGFVTYKEGIEWAKQHPNARSNPIPDNMLYLDTSLIDFGSISISVFEDDKTTASVNLFNFSNTVGSIINGRLRDSVYALGVVGLQLVSRSECTVRIINDEATDYDWNGGGSMIRSWAIGANNLIFGLDSNKHGFKVWYYGVGKLKR